MKSIVFFIMQLFHSLNSALANGVFGMEMFVVNKMAVDARPTAIF